MKSGNIACYRCGASLAALSLPLSRQDMCPSCSVYLHVCRMCVSFDENIAEQCREDDADEVHEKERANFCEWFKPGEISFDAVRAAADHRSRDELEALFTEGDEAAENRSKNAAVEDLFK